MNTVMVTGHFDPFHTAHLDMIEQAVEVVGSGQLICVVSTDKQLMIKKGRVNIPQGGRLRILSLILKGLGVYYIAMLNFFDDDATITRALIYNRPNILFRGYDKTIDTMPASEREVCERLNIKIMHAANRIGERHGSEMKL